eukprot:scaffold9765_cov54-Cylindrotheca_fusiformis.AAC.2
MELPDGNTMTDGGAATATATVVKPALVHHETNEDLKKKKKKKATASLKWDEEKIKEHDLLRGTRMKIDEPDTPYNYDSGSEDGSHVSNNNRHPEPEISWDKLQHKLDAAAAVQDAYPP